jgi:hypothetical protein
MTNVVLEMQRQQCVAHEKLFRISVRVLVDLDVSSLECPIAAAVYAATIGQGGSS